MGAFISSFFSNRECRTLMLGLDAAGKTTILYNLKLGGERIQTIPTIGFNVEELTYKKLSLNVWDVGGQDRIRVLWKHYFDGTECLIWVVDSSDAARIEESGAEMREILKSPELDHCLVLVYANKMDLPHAMSVAQIADKLGIASLRNRKWKIQPTSAVNGTGLYEGLDWITTALEPRRPRP